MEREVFHFTSNKKERLNIMLLNSLGRVLVASGLVAVTSFMASTAAFAAPAALVPNYKNASVTLSGTVASTLAFTASSANALNIETLTYTAPQCVSVLSYSTNANGLKVTAGSSATPFVLTSNAATSPTIPYELGVSSGTSLPTLFVGLGGQLFETTGPNLLTANTSLYIRQASGGPVAVYPGTYLQTITLTATDK
ncbi:MAG: hypothetical protein WCP16_08905 [Pseudanabaena sp. ELA645]